MNAAGRRFRDVVRPHRVVYTIALAAAALLLVFGFQASKDTRATTCGSGVITHLVPCPGDTDLRQGLIGVDLAAGYQAVLVVDTTEIPLDQYRTGGANQVYFQPGPGTETGALAPGRHSATVVYWQQTSDRSHAQQYTWSFSAQ